MTTYTDKEQRIANVIISLGGTPIVFTGADTDDTDRQTLLAWQMNMLKGRCSVDTLQQDLADARVTLLDTQTMSCDQGRAGEHFRRVVRLTERLLAHLGMGKGNKIGVQH